MLTNGRLRAILEYIVINYSKKWYCDCFTGKEMRMNASGILLLSNLFHLAFCLFLIIYMRHALENQNNSHARCMFKRFVRCVTWALVADLASYIFDRRQFFGAAFLSHVSMILSVFLTAYVGYLLNLFFDVVFHVKDEHNRRKTMYFLPTALISLLLFINIFNGCLFSIGEDNIYIRGPLSILSFALQYLAFATVAIRASIFKFSVKTIRYIKLRNSFILVGALTLFFGILQIVAQGNIAFQCLGITASIFIIFSRFQDDQITNDILTGLNNRYALDAYIEDKIKIYSDGSHGMTELYLIMMDINYFKRINDTYGHVEGDKALKLVAHILKTIGGVYKSSLFIARFGGDEFAAVFETVGEHKVQILCEDIKNALADETKDYRYLLTMGAGHAVYTGKNMSIEELYDRADKALYADKSREKELNS